MIIERIITYLSVFIAILVILPFHEFAHAFVAVKCGDNTPKNYGRYTLNPLAHFDRVGLICFLFAGFGWAKPVPINPNNFKKYKKGCFLVSIAGVVFNYILSFFAYPLIYFSLKIPDIGFFDDVIYLSLYYIYALGLSFFVFNLIPFYPLDGFRVLDCFSKKRTKLYYVLRNYGTYILIFLMLLSVCADYTGFSQIDILGNFLRFARYYVGYPIYLFWGLFF